jgi:predicted metal-dependent peptidase
MIVLKYDAFEKYSRFAKVNESEDSQDDPNNLLRKEVMGDVKRCVSKMMGKYPFFGEYIIDCRFLYDHPKIDTMATDGKNIYINSRFAATLTDEEMVFILCHEVLHIMLLHVPLRMTNLLGSRPDTALARKWNFAADYELNPMLVAEGLLSADHVKNKLKALYDEKYIGKSAETIFNELDGEEGDEPTPGSQEYPVNVGDVIYTKDKKWGKISKINANGTYDSNEITEDEAMTILNS